jgi:MoxR-like ATPase
MAQAAGRGLIWLIGAEPVRNVLGYCFKRGQLAPIRPIHEKEGTVKNVQEPAERVVANVERVIVGKHLEVRMALVALLCEGHILIEDVPGVGKTMLAKAISRSVGCTFRRIQFTPDLLPSDVTGLSIFNQKTQEFEFRPGPIMAQVVLADEINRATPKTQSALLECMEERQATIDGTTYPMPSPFLVIATQNPIEYEGTFALPEAQLDRFMLRLRMGYPKAMEEIVILDEQKRTHPIESIGQVLGVEELRQMQSAIKEIYVDQAVAEYVVRLVTATREHPDVYLGASPRGSINLYRSAQAFAAMDGRDYVIPDDVKGLAVAVLAHRLIVKSQASLREVDPDRIVHEIIEQVPIAVATGAPTS